MISVKIHPFKLERFFAKYEFKAPYLLSSSDCETFTIQEILDLEEKRDESFRAVPLGYRETQGGRALREAITTLYETLEKNQILAFTGAEEGIFVFMNACFSPGDHIIVQHPAYQSLYELPRSIGCRISKWKIKDGSESWELNLNDLNQLITPNTKAIVINFPHNPTGAMIKTEQLEKIIEIAKSHNLYLFSDEVYRFLEYNPDDRLPTVADLYEKGLSLGVMSKSFGLAGLRIGWIGSQNTKILHKMMKFKDYTTICNSAPSEWLSTLALQHKEILLSRNLDIIRKNLILLDHFFEKYCNLFEWHRPTAGSIGLVKILIDQRADEFCLDVVEAVGVLLVPATEFDFHNQYFRIGFGRANLPEALVKFEDYLQNRFYTNST